jgi:hypothetical protein
VVSNKTPRLPLAASLLLKAGAVSYRLRPSADYSACAAIICSYKWYSHFEKHRDQADTAEFSLLYKMSFMFGSFLQVPRLGVSTLEIQIESGVGWRPDSKEIVLEVVADKTKFMVMSQD